MTSSTPRKMGGRGGSNFELRGTCIFTDFSGGGNQIGTLSDFKASREIVGYQTNSPAW